MSESLEQHHSPTGKRPNVEYGSDPFPAVLNQVRNVAGIIGVIGMALLLIGLLFGPFPVFRGILFGYWFWLCISMGGFGFVMISHLTGGGWGVVARRFGEAAALNVPFLFLASILVLFGMKWLFPWYNFEDYKNLDEVYKVLVHRQPWFTPSWFVIRQIAYFAIWSLWIFMLRSGSIQLDHGDNPRLRLKLRRWAASGMVMFFVTTTSLAFDLILSRETNWYSSIIGFITAVSMGLSGMAFIAISVSYFSSRKPLKSVLNPQYLNDLGNILLALVVLWMYTSFAQFLIMWNGNLPEDVNYYVSRGMGVVWNGWRFVALALFLFHFLLPFFLLLMKGLKRKVKTLTRICCVILVMRFVESLWVFAPASTHPNPTGHFPQTGHVLWTDFAAFFGIGGLWMWNYIRILASRPLLAKNAADQPELISQVDTHGSHAQHAYAV